MRIWLLGVVSAAVGCGSSAALDVDASPPTPALEIEYIAHSSFRLTAHDGTSALLDPFASKVWLGYDFPEAYLAADVIVSSHPHYDHDYGEFIGRTVPWAQATNVLRDPEDDRDVGALGFRGIVGKHADPYGQEFQQKNTIWTIEHAGLRIAHWGDNGPITDAIAQQLVGIDVLMLPIDGAEHILSNEAVEGILNGLRPGIVIPMHYRHPDLEVSAGSPEDLGPIEPWLENRTDVRRLGVHHIELRSDEVPSATEVFVFEHAPELVVP